MAFKLFATLLLVAAPLSLAQNYQGQHAAGGYADDEAHWGPAEYAFEYAVHDDHTKDFHSHKESRKGDLTQGEYSLVEPDGTIRTVKYHVDGKSGFVAEVIRSGHAVHAAAPIAIAKPIVAAYKPVVAAPVAKPIVSAHVYQAAAPVTKQVSAPVHAAPMKTVPVHAAHIKAAPVHEAPVQDAPIAKAIIAAPVYKDAAPVHTTPESAASVKSAPMDIAKPIFTTTFKPIVAASKPVVTSPFYHATAPIRAAAPNHAPFFYAAPITKPIVATYKPYYRTHGGKQQAWQ